MDVIARQSSDFSESEPWALASKPPPREKILKRSQKLLEKETAREERLSQTEFLQNLAIQMEHKLQGARPHHARNTADGGGGHLWGWMWSGRVHRDRT